MKGSRSNARETVLAAASIDLVANNSFVVIIMYIYKLFVVPGASSLFCEGI